jgi:chemotaxis signal transduction protein
MTDEKDVGGTLEGIECVCGDARVVVPAQHIDQIIEYEVSPLPLARKWVSGVGVHSGDLLLSISLRGRHEGRTRVKGILLRATAGVASRWVFEVDEVLMLAKVRASRAALGMDGGPRWVCGALRDDGGRIGWLDVPAMLVDLGAEAAS